MEKKFEDAMKLLAATNQKPHNQNDLESGLSEDTTNGDVEFLGTKKNNVCDTNNSQTNNSDFSKTSNSDDKKKFFAYVSSGLYDWQ